MKYKVYSEDWSGFEFEKEFDSEEEAIKDANSDFVTETYKRVLVTRINSDNPEWAEEDIIWDSDTDFKIPEMETTTEENLTEDLVQVGDVVKIKDIGEGSPWEGLTGTVEWIDDEDLGEYTTVTVAVNFPTNEGEKIVRNNFDMKNLFKQEEVPVEQEETTVVEETPVGEKLEESAHLLPILSISVDTAEEMEELTDALKAEGIRAQDWEVFNNHYIEIHGDNPTSSFINKIKNALKKCGIKLEEVLKEDKHIETIEVPHEEYTSIEDIIRVNDELDAKAKAGKLIGLRKEKDKLILSEPAINGIWTLFLNDKGYIVRIVLC